MVIKMNKIKATYEILTSVSEGGIRELQHIEKIGCDDRFYWDNYE